MSISPEDFTAKFAKNHAKERKLVEQGADPRYVCKVLKELAPVYSYHPREVDRVQADRVSPDLLVAAKSDHELGPLLPHGLVIGGITGLTHAKLLALHRTKQTWWKRFLLHTESYDEVLWILPVKGSGSWAIHNMTVCPDKQCSAIVIPALVKGFNHIRVSRLELFIKEHTHE